jgi:thermitase
MQKLHHDLGEAHPWYSFYHKIPYVSFFNFALFVGFAYFSASILEQRVNPPTQLAAVGALLPGESQSQASDPEKYVPGQIIVKFKAGVAKNAHDKTLKDAGSSVKSTIPQIRVEILSVPIGAEKKVRDALAHNPQVQFVELDGMTEPSFTPNDTLTSSMWALNKVSAFDGWGISKGAGITIAILDSGIDGGHQDLAANMVPGYNFMLSSTNTAPDGACHHGTPVAGAAAAVGNNATGTIGIAWQSKILPVVIAGPDSTGTGCWASWSNLASGITYAVDHGARVINISYGGASSGSSLLSAETYAWNKGAIIVASAGNDAQSGNPIRYPASDPHVVSAAATDSNDAPASFSEYNQYVDLAAPGANVIDVDERGSMGYTTSDFAYMSGTSFSAPTIAGLAALVWSVNPSLTNQQVIDLMQKNADDLGDPGYDVHYGWGRINLNRTLSATAGVAPTLDTIAPSVTMPTIGSGGYVKGGVNFSPSNSDNVSVVKVEFWKDGALFATDTTGPFTFYWDSTLEASGIRTLQLKAYDAAGNVGVSSVVTVTIDNEKPSVSISSPTLGTSVAGPVTIVSKASDVTSGITTMNIYIDGIRVCSVYSSSVSCPWNSLSVFDGTHVIKSEASDKAGNVASTTATIKTINNAPDTAAPAASITNPLSGALVSKIIPVSFSASDNSGSVVKAEVLEDGQVLNTLTTVASTTSNSVQWDTTKETNGSHSLAVRVFDAAGNVGTSPNTIVTISNTTLDIAQPVTSISSPASGSTLSSAVIVSASAADNVGVTQVDLFEDGLLVSSDTSAPYAWSWDTTLDQNGNHTLQTKAYDAAGNVGSSAQLTVAVSNTVANLPPTVTIASPANGARIKTNGNTTVSASASDADGIASIVITIDGAVVKRCANVLSCSYAWSNKSAATGSHTISVTAVDKSSSANSSSASITVTK